MNHKPILFSGMQPTGEGLTLGNYLGALKNWVQLQATYECIYCIVNLHAITVRQDPKILKEATYRTLATYMACGIDPSKSILFKQSQVPEHAELGWILECHTYMGELSRMTQFKDKSAKQESIATGLFTYPSLMAADILLYQTHLVPVGHDQKQHLELARDLAIRMNNTYGELFKVPEVYMPPVGARIMSLADPSSKMSKSSEEAMATVFVLDKEEVILKKFKRAVTDSINKINYTDAQLGVKNLITIQASITGENPEQLAASLADKQYGFLKQQTADLVIELFRPARLEAERLLNDKTYLDEVLKTGAAQASLRARPTLDKVKQSLGL
jgi:tryptophanyl-tRNA synthetase